MMSAWLHDGRAAGKTQTGMHGTAEMPTKAELPKEGENKVRFKNHHKQPEMKAPFVVYANFESVIRKIAKKDQATIKTEVHKWVFINNCKE